MNIEEINLKVEKLEENVEEKSYSSWYRWTVIDLGTEWKTLQHKIKDFERKLNKIINIKKEV